MDKLMKYDVGTLVKARGREWVVLPGSQQELLLLRPLGGTDAEIAGVCPALEKVMPAQFELPNPEDIGDYQSCRLLRDAVRLGFRSGAGPFRSFGRIAVEPRPYQLVPLLMALKLNPVRLLIADDVGVGKTVEACLVARELIDRGEVSGLAVLCPPHLAEQWQTELREKFHINAELVLAGTVPKLERSCRLGQSLFDVYPFVIVSTDFIKSDRRRIEFIRSCPDLVIVDEAHTCVSGNAGNSALQQRFQLLRALSQKPDRHMLLMTATPHSGKEDAFRSLLSILDEKFAELPTDLSGKGNEQARRRLAAHIVQRRRGDIRYYLQANTPFPQREERVETYRLSPAYAKLFNRVLAYARESVLDGDNHQHRQRVRWWSALAMLRSLGSSPAAAAATLRNRSSVADGQTTAETDEIGRRMILDLAVDDAVETPDLIPGSDAEEFAIDGQRNRKLLLDLAREADKLCGDQDEKLLKAVKLIEELLEAGYNPIIFCRFIPTAEYVAQQLRQRLKRQWKDVGISAVTGTLPPVEREESVLGLAAVKRRILVATDCLSEGINLQEHFDAVVHYDLSWNPTRHEQREGRVDRFGQPKEKVRVLTYYGIDNRIDGIVLDVLINKHKKIRSSLGISVNVPVDTHEVVEAIFEGLLLRGKAGGSVEQLTLDFVYIEPIKEELFKKWEEAGEREKRSRTIFAQERLAADLDEVARELQAAQAAIGSGADVKNFVINACSMAGGVVSGNDPYNINLRESTLALREAVDAVTPLKNQTLTAAFSLPIPDGVLYLHRTHPIVESIACYVLNTTLDSGQTGPARRSGVIRTGQVQKRTTLLLLRLRFHIQSAKKEPLLVEDSCLLAFRGSAQNTEWLSDQEAEKLLDAVPEANISKEQASNFIRKALETVSEIMPAIDNAVKQRGEEILEAHRRVRNAAMLASASYSIEPQLPADILGIYVYLPKP